MPSFAVRPDDLGAAAALTAGDGPALDEVRRLVAAALASASGSIEGSLAAAVEGYGQVESTVAVTLGDARSVLATGLGSAAGAYASTDAAVASGFGGRQ